MEFADERIKQEYVEDVSEFEEPASLLTPTFMNILLPIVIKGERNPEKFPISATNVCDWSGQRKRRNLTRLIDGKNSPFILNRDYKYEKIRTEKNQELKEIFMTVETFKRVVSNTNTEFGRQVLAYVWKVEKLFRDQYGSRAKHRLKMEEKDPQAIKRRNKIFLGPGVTLSPGMGCYILSFTHKQVKYFYHGSSGDIKTRLVNHKNDLPNGCDITVLEWTQTPRAEMIESCRDGYGEKLQVPIPEGIRGMKSLYYDNPLFWDVVDHCNGCFVDTEQKWQAGPGKFQTPSPPLPDPTMYPVKHSKTTPRKNEHSRSYGRIARYEPGKTPHVLPNSR